MGRQIEMHLKEQLRRFEEELSQAGPQEREPMVRAMTRVLLSLKKEHEQMLATITQALNNLNSQKNDVGNNNGLMDKINRIIQPQEKYLPFGNVERKETDNVNLEEAGSTIAYLKKYNLLVDVSKETFAQPISSPKFYSSSPPQTNRIFSSPVSKIL